MLPSHPQGLPYAMGNILTAAKEPGSLLPASSCAAAITAEVCEVGKREEFKG